MKAQISTLNLKLTNKHTNWRLDVINQFLIAIIPESGLQLNMKIPFNYKKKNQNNKKLLTNKEFQ